MKKKKITWEYPKCDLCGSKKASIFLDELTTWEYKGKFRIVKCNRCNLIYLHPRPTRKSIGYYYDSSRYWGDNLKLAQTVNSDYKNVREKIYGPLYKVILKTPRRGAIFDVGSGLGIFLSKFKDLNWDTYGNELSSDAARFTRRNFKISVIVGDFVTMQIPKRKFDVIVFSSVLEHLHSPRKALQKAYQMLRSGGHVAITVPNINSLGFILLGRNWFALQPPKHLYHFSYEALSALLSQEGFVIESVSQWYWSHAYYGIFESFRYLFSPKFEKKENGGIKHKAFLVNKPYSKTLKNEIGKLFVFFISCLIVITGFLMRRGEALTIYAKKN